ncbi:uncharacterized protein DUF4179 [Ruminiclostridium sufflavum DSM 19573]|uniref:Uncharacterized protein DUF4179 n=1 Tax=Ruminiclostridium sufflavum DSM 19573 TaxID=1121337 RepID=A0A318Y2X9_9FIRM|nr:DUF4179 domain-containing protein [Ruminiclostridium sufflavum]PYG85836.1 uncharacterized protein DUF4179 [Ruminiclostridium sufflavum DSM 19573]
MHKNNWSQEFPAVPESFHNMVEKTLAEISVEKNRRLSRKGFAAVLLAAVLTLGSITAFAAGYFNWNQKLAEIFGADNIQQNSLIEKGVTQQAKSSSTDNGLTIDLVQTLQDKDYFYALLEVTAPKDIKLTDTNLFENWRFDVSGQEEYSYSTSHGFMDVIQEPEITNKRYYEIWIKKSIDFNEKDFTLHFKNLQADAGKLDMYTILEGDWTLSWKMSYKDSTKYFDVNKKYNLSGYDILVKRVEITPLSMTIYFDGGDVKAMEKAEKVDLDKLEFLKPLSFKGVRYNDGKVVSISGGGGEGFDNTTGEYKLSTCFDKVIQIENVNSLLFGTEKSEIGLAN